MDVEARPSPLRALSDFIASMGMGYDRIGSVLIMSASWYMITMGSIGLAFANPLALVLTIAVVPAYSAAITYVGNRFVHKEDSTLADMGAAFIRYWSRSFAIGLTMAVVAGAVVLNISLISRIRAWWAMPALGVWVYVGMFAALAGNLALPLMVEQDIGYLKILKRSTILVMDNPGYVLVSGLISMILVVCGIVPTFGLLMGIRGFVIPTILGFALFAGVYSLYVNRCIVRLLRRYGADRKSSREELEAELKDYAENKREES